MSLSLINAGKLKRTVNASQNSALLMFKHKDVVNEAFQGDASNVKYNFIDYDNWC